jgi:hypothetical protein
MMSSILIPIPTVVLVGVLVAVLVVCLVATLLMNRPDPKLTLLHGLMQDFPREQEAERSSAEKPAEPEDDDSEMVPGPRSYDFFA